ncbi:hypothetical protein PCASD_16008 [Puccinia coronata f. sp. avenae]|uniref:Uncharacterized protein n=1 Tax=Puccinia coronata f. sp. avenae TaxID=200324 RepID=A0A2N5TUI5_9BASI|nr:hypothetical protein PCASD_16008 [Puccinia coronata f. sp. avenae]
MAAARPPDLTSGSDLGLLALVWLVLIFSCPPPTSHRTSQEPFHQTQTRHRRTRIGPPLRENMPLSYEYPRRTSASTTIGQEEHCHRPTGPNQSSFLPIDCQLKNAAFLHDLPTGANCSLRTSQAIASMPSPSQLVSLDRLFVLGLGLLVVLNLDLLDLIANPAEDLHHVNWTL